VPPPRRCHVLAWDPVRRLVVLHGGEVDGDRLDDTWEWDGEDWRELAPGRSPGGRERHALAYDTLGGELVLFGGTHDGVRLEDDTWTLPSLPEARPAHRLAVDVSVAGPPAGSELLSLRVAFQAGGRGVVEGVESLGAELLAWDPEAGAWRRTEVSNGADAASPEPVAWTADGHEEIVGLLFRDALHFAVAPVGSNGRGYAEVATDHVELVLRYRLP